MTDLLLKLLGARIDDAVRVTDASLTFRGGVGLGWVVFFFLVLGAAAYGIYRRSPVALPSARRRLLTALRILFFLMILILLLRPVLALTVEGSVRRLLVLLIDASASMEIRDPRLEAADQKRAALAMELIDPRLGLGQTLDAGSARQMEQVARLDLVRHVLRNDKMDLLRRFDRDFDVAAFTFGQTLVELSAVKTSQSRTNARAGEKRAAAENYPWVGELASKDPVTALGDALREVINRKRGQPLAGVFLLSDGANNSGRQPREMAQSLRQEGVPVYAYGVGLTSPRDIIVGNLFAPDVSFVKDELAVTVRVRAQSLQGQSADLVLRLGRQTVAAATITFTGEGEQVVRLKFTPQEIGDFELTASIAARPDEAVQDNNSRSQRLRVVDGKMKVLLVDQTPRWEFRYLQAMLLRDRRVNLKCFLVDGDKAIAREENSPYLEQFPASKEELFKYDLVLYGDVDPKRISPNQLDLLNKLVADFGGGLVMIAGKRFSPAAYRRTVIEKMLPVEFESAPGERTTDGLAHQPILLELTAAGKASPMLRLSDQAEENANIWKQMPPVYWVAKVSRPKPAAEVLLVDPDPAKQSRFGKMPVMAVQQYGLGQVMYVGTDNLWRWRKNVGDAYYTALWGQIAQRLSLQRLLGVSKRTQLSTEKQNYLTGDRVSVYARLYSPGYEPIQEPAVKGIYGLKSSPVGGTEVTLRPVPEQPGLYRGEFVAPAPGVYGFSVEPDPSTTLDFNVSEARFEFGDTAMNETLLRDIAATTGGAFLREEDLYRLPDMISRNSEKVRSPVEIDLWASPLYFLLLVGIVTFEWILRKRAYLK